MEYYATDDTIAAIATGPSYGAICIIRISGKDAFSIVGRLFQPKAFASFAMQPSSSIHYGKIYTQSGEVLDEVLVSKFAAPHTYTTQDVAEINCHGGVVSARLILDELCRLGARPAQPGEFTKRAFLSGRIDLVQAQAVSDLVVSKSRLAQKNSLYQLDGALSNFLNEIKAQLMDLIGRIEVMIQYPEYDMPDVDVEQMRTILSDVQNKLLRLKQTYTKGDMLQDGFSVVLCGKPNVGKSSLLNALLGYDKAIVTEIAGTTRDVVDACVLLGETPVRFYDTAGIRSACDVVESIGVKKAVDMISKAHLVLFVVDGSMEMDEQDYQVLADLDSEKTLVVLNKCDLVQVEKTRHYFSSRGYACLAVSALQMQGIAQLEQYIIDKASLQTENVLETLIITNTRHKTLIDEALRSVQSALATLDAGLGTDLSEMDVRDAWQSLASIVGEVCTEDVIDAIFENFCLGK